MVLLNPLTILGFPTGKNTVTITGTLDIREDEKQIKSYHATATIEDITSLYIGNTLSELRKEGLATVKKNIEDQLCLDKEFLSKYSVIKH